ncbi:MAG TPA: hypothetical protein ENI87_04605 [bacterium]|nr:hypothetical protein [bacterium]
MDCAGGWCSWVVGPSGKEGRALVSTVRYFGPDDAPCRWVLRAARRAPEIRVRGADGFAAVGPLKVRVAVSRDAAVADVAVDGDGLITLPILPPGPISLLLMDRAGGVIAERVVHLEHTREVAFGTAVRQRFRAVDPQGQPLPGVSVRQVWHCEHPLAAPLMRWSMRSSPDRELGVTDDDGVLEAWITAPSADGLSLFYGTRSGFVGARSCYAGLQPLAPSAAREARSGELQLVMRPAQERRLAIRGLPAAAELRAHLRGDFAFRDPDGFPLVEGKTRSPTLPLVKGQVGADIYSSEAPGWVVQGSCSGRRVLIDATASPGEVRVNWRDLRRVRFEVVDAEGKGVSGAVVGLFDGADDFPVQWVSVLRADAQGRIELMTNWPRERALHAYAYGVRSHGLAHGGRGDEVRVALQPLQRVTLRVANAAGKAMAGVPVEVRLEQYPEGVLVNCALDAFVDVPPRGVTDAKGERTVLLPGELLQGVLSVRAVSRVGTSDWVPLVGGQVQMTVLPADAR